MAASFLREALVDEICVYIAPKVLGAAGTADIGEPLTRLDRVIGLHHVQSKAFGEDVRISGRLESGSLSLRSSKVEIYRKIVGST